MTREEQKNRWWQKMLAKHGSEEAVREFMRQNAKKANHQNHKGGFNYMSKEELKAMSQKANQARWNKKAN